MSWASSYLNDDAPIRQAYAMDRAGGVMADHQQRAMDAKTAEESPSYVGDALYGMAHGVTSAVDETLQFGGDLLELAGSGREYGDVTWLRGITGTMDEPETMVGQATAGITQFLTAYALPGGVALKAGKGALRAGKAIAGKGAEAAAPGAAAKVGEAMARGAVADAVGFDPHQARLHTMLNEVPALRPVVNDWMASNDPDDPAWEGRLKNAIEGLALGVPAEMLFIGLRRAVSASKAGRPERAQISPDSQALKDVAERTAVEAEAAGEVVATQARGAEEASTAAGLPSVDDYIAARRAASPEMTEKGAANVAEGYTWAVQNNPAIARTMAEEVGLDTTPPPAAAAKPKAEVKDPEGAPAEETLDERMERLRSKERAWRAERSPAAVRQPLHSGDTLDLDRLDRVIEREKGWHTGTTGEALQKMTAEGETAAEVLGTARAMQDEMVSMHGAAGEAGVLTPELRLAADVARKRVEEWSVAPGNTARQAAARTAVKGYREQLAAAAKDLDPRETPALGADAPQRWQAMADREWGSVPLMGRHSSDMARPRYAARRLTPVSVSRTGRSPDMGTQPGDEALMARRPDEVETLAVDEAYAGGLRSDPDRPIDIYFEDVRTLDDLDGLVREVDAANAALRAAAPAAARSARETLRTLLSDRFGMGRWQTRAAGGDTPQAALEAVAAASDTLRRLAAMASHGAASTEVQTQLVRALMKTQALAWRAAGDMGRAREALAAADIPVVDAMGLSRKLWQHRRLGDEGGQHVTALAGALRNTETLGEVLGIARQWRSTKMPFREKALAAGSRYVSRPAREIWINSVLSSPATHMRNIVGNMVMPVMQVPEHFIAGVVSRGIMRPQSYAETAREVQAMVAGFAGGWRDAVMLARRDMSISMAQRVGDMDRAAAIARRLDEDRPGMNAMREEFIAQIKVDDATRLGDESAVGLPQAMMEWSTGQPWAKAAHIFDRGVRKAITAPTAMLQAEDVFMKTLTYRMELWRRATNQGIEEGLRGDALKDRMRQIIAAPDEHMPDLRAAAMQQSHVNTFTQALPGWGQASLDWLNAFPGARYVVPFFKTPSNIVLTAGEYTPGVNLLYQRHREALARGGREGAQVKAKMAVGTGVLTTFALMGHNGEVTGGDPTNPQFRATARKLGRREYSFKVGDTWLDYRFVGGPFGLVAGMGADVGMLMAAASTDEEMDQVSAYAQAAALLAGSILDETWLGSMAEFFDMVGEGNPAATQRWIASTAKGFVPLSAAGDDVRQIVDTLRGVGVRQDLRVREGLAGGDEPGWEWLSETMRGAAREMGRPFRWWGDKGKPNRDLYGDPVTYYRPEGGPVNVGEATGAALSPLAFHQQMTDPLSKALLRYMPALPRIPDNHVVRGPSWAGSTRAIEIDADAHDWITMRAGRLFKQAGTRLVGLKGFEALPSDTARRGQLAQAWRDARTRAKREAEERFPEFKRRIAHEKLRLRDEARGQR